jgi:hypothetical protein
MPYCYIDHIVITAPDLEVGAEFVRQTLGVIPQSGGAHPRMGTHNLLLRLGDSLYLEVISTNPDAPRPERSRWFALDSLDPDSTPKLAGWVVRTSDIQTTAAGSSEPLGAIESMTRGTLSWLITIPDDGSLIHNGVAPALIEWNTEPHPAVKLQDFGLSLLQVELFHPHPERISDLLKSIGFQGPVSASQLPNGVEPHLVAHINTPKGLRKLSAPDRHERSEP